jgi:hypothetical protein
MRLKPTLHESKVELRRERTRMRKRATAKRLREQAALIRWWLLQKLGDYCTLCGSVDRLEFDHPHGRDYELCAISPYQRMQRYLKDWAAGDLRVLCKACNQKLGGGIRYNKRKGTRHGYNKRKGTRHRQQDR